MTPRMQEHLADGAKASTLVVGWMFGINWASVGAFLMALYTLILILDKLGALNPIKARVLSLFKRSPA